MEQFCTMVFPITGTSKYLSDPTMLVKSNECEVKNFIHISIISVTIVSNLLSTKSNVREALYSAYDKQESTK
jgi:hypothetical protein